MCGVGMFVCVYMCVCAFVCDYVHVCVCVCVPVFFLRGCVVSVNV